MPAGEQCGVRRRPGGDGPEDALGQPAGGGDGAGGRLLLRLSDRVGGAGAERRGQASEAERYAVAQQFARFGTVCRLFAPLYRQVTLRGLVAAGGDRALALGDVKAAWTRYLQADNDGRGVILIGHSQGARMLKALLAEAIVGTPAEKRIIAAYLIGNNLLVPAGKVSGGEAGRLPLCERGDQTGCAVSYVSFRSSAPPPANARFGRSEAAGMEVACVSPAMLSGDKGELRPVLPVRGRQIGGRVNPVPPFLTAVKTPSYTMTGAFSGVCMRSADGAHYLSVAPRASVYDDFLARAERPDGGWGLHVADVSLAMGNLVTLAAMQRDAWLKSRR